MHIPVGENWLKSISLYALWNSKQRKNIYYVDFFMWKSDILYALGILRQSEHEQLSYNCLFIRTVLFILHTLMSELLYVYTVFYLYTRSCLYAHIFSVYM